MSTKELYNAAGSPVKFNMCGGSKSTKTHVNEIMVQLSDQFIQDWFNKLNAPEGSRKNYSNKLRTYKLFKKEFQLEEYLKYQLQNKHQFALTKTLSQLP